MVACKRQLKAVFELFDRLDCCARDPDGSSRLSGDIDDVDALALVNEDKIISSIV
jgi:hypothetical protein